MRYLLWLIAFHHVLTMFQPTPQYTDFSMLRISAMVDCVPSCFNHVSVTATISRCYDILPCEILVNSSWTFFEIYWTVHELYLWIFHEQSMSQWCHIPLNCSWNIHVNVASLWPAFFGKKGCINVMYLSVCLSCVTSACVVQGKDAVSVNRYCILAL